MTDFTATIHNPKRATEWKTMLGTTTIPITSFYPTLATLPGHSKAEMVYMLDLDQITAEQLKSVIQHVATKFEYTTRWVEEMLPEYGIPIRAEDVTITIERPEGMW